MKLFPKKRKTKAAADVAPKEFKSDEVVEELLLKDPSTWNSKQRRMIKRYRLRKAEAEARLAKEDSTKEKQQVDGKEKEKKRNSEPQNHDEPRVEDEKEAPVDLSDQDVCRDDKKQNPGGEEEGEVGMRVTEEKEEPSVEKLTTEEVVSVESAEIDESMRKLLDQLNSKQRRKLTRKLERRALTIEEARQEAQIILNELSEEGSANKRGPALEEKSKQSKRRRKDVDWSTLPPHERQRREEQRRLQQEAAKLRAESGSVNPHRHCHPLNSERRRANRRKPKWAKQNFVGNEHHSSGYSMRRSQKGS